MNRTGIAVPYSSCIWTGVKASLAEALKQSCLQGWLSRAALRSAPRDQAGALRANLPKFEVSGFQSSLMKRRTTALSDSVLITTNRQPPRLLRRLLLDFCPADCAPPSSNRSLSKILMELTSVIESIASLRSSSSRFVISWFGPKLTIVPLKSLSL